MNTPRLRHRVYLAIALLLAAVPAFARESDTNRAHRERTQLTLVSGWAQSHIGSALVPTALAEQRSRRAES
jgi:hypothetical protein